MRKVLLIGLITILMGMGCKKARPTQEETEEFLSRPADIGENVENSLSGQAIADFFDKFYYMSKEKPNLLTKHGIKNAWKWFTHATGTKQEEYGTYEWNDTLGWVLTDSTYPTDGYLFKWTFTDSANVQHNAELLVDSVEIFVTMYGDSLPARVHSSLKVDNQELAWMHYDASYTTEGIPQTLNFKAELVNIIQVGLSAQVSSITLEQIPVATVTAWIIDYTQNNYRMDFKFTGNTDNTMNLEWWDSDGWKLTMDFSAPVVVTESNYVGKKIEVTGEITHKNVHAADVEGTLWDPDQEPDHVSEIYVVWPDGTKTPLEDYLASEE